MTPETGNIVPPRLDWGHFLAAAQVSTGGGAPNGAGLVAGGQIRSLSAARS
jgi:hypothetical protein